MTDQEEMLKAIYNMSDEEALKVLKHMRGYWCMGRKNGKVFVAASVQVALNKAIQALEEKVNKGRLE